MLVLLLSSESIAKDKFWVSNKLEVGYDKVFVSNQVTFDRDEFIKNKLAMGLKFRVSDSINFKTFYLLENEADRAWKNNHFLGVTLNLKLQ